MSYTDPTLKKLFALSGNVCAFPGCTAPIVDTDLGVVVGDICHIKARSESGPRYDPSQTEAERNGYENLLVMCAAHNRIVDSKKTQHLYPVALLQEYKRNHESQYKGSVVDEAALDTFIEQFTVRGSVIVTRHQIGGQNANTITNIYATPTKPKVSLTPIVESLLEKVDHEAGLHYYNFRVELRNDGPTTVREFRIDVEIPERYMEGAGSFAAEVPSRRPGVTKMFRHTQQNFRDFALYHGDTYPVFLLKYILKKHHYLDGITETIQVRVYAEDQVVSETEYPIIDMLNAEQVKTILGPRKQAIRKICEATRAFVGEEGDLTDEIMYLSEEPTEGRRSVYIENAYHMGKALAKAGWLVFESEDAMSIRLTDEGVRAGS